MLEDHPSVPASSDASIVAMISEGRDRARAEAELCARYRRRVHLYGLKHLGNATDAEDLVQDVLARVIERARAGDINDPDKLGSFVLGMCRMQVLGRRRAHSRRAQILARYGDPRFAQDASVSHAAAAADLARVRDCLATLSDRDRAVLLLSFYSELDAASVARELGIESAYVRVVRHRALDRLRACVKGAGEDDA